MDALLVDRGFRLEVEPGGRSVTATRMASGADPASACAIRALHRPAMSTETVTVRLAPGAAAGAGDVRAEVQARFLEMDADVISGALSKRPCPSLGVLERDIRRAARGD